LAPEIEPDELLVLLGEPQLYVTEFGRANCFIGSPGLVLSFKRGGAPSFDTPNIKEKLVNTIMQRMVDLKSHMLVLLRQFSSPVVLRCWTGSALVAHNDFAGVFKISALTGGQSSTLE
jgi:hypothetical protein